MKKTILFLLLTTFINIRLCAQWSALGSCNGLNANGYINCICSDHFGNIYAGGSFSNSSGKQYVAKWDGTVWSELGGLNALSANNAVRTICTDNSGNVYAAGFFYNSSGFWYVAKWNGSTWSELGGLNSLAANQSINSICSDNSGNIYASGYFTSSNIRYVAKWNGSTWSQLAGLTLNLWVNSLCTDASGNVYAAGAFSNTSGKKYVAKWNGSSWSELGGLNALAANNYIYSICTDSSGNIYAGGTFTNTQGKKYVAKWNGSAWSELGGVNALDANGAIMSICSDNAGNIYAGGGFQYPLSPFDLYVAQWNGSIWSKVGAASPLNPNNGIYTICVDDSYNVYAAGLFSCPPNFPCYVAVHTPTTGIEIITSIDKIFLAPNPAKDIITISFAEKMNDAMRNKNIEVSDVLGNVVQLRSFVKAKSQTIDISALNRGLYFIRSGNKYAKFIKE